MMTDETSLTEEFYDELHTFIGPQLTSIASDLGEQFTKDSRNNSKTMLCTSSTSINTLGGDEPSTKYLFFNELNCQHNGTVHINHKLLKKKNNVPQDIMNLLTDLYVQDTNQSNSCEVIVKTLNDYWIVKRSTNWRHSFIVFNKSTTLLEVADEASKIYDQHLNDVFNRVWLQLATFAMLQSHSQRRREKQCCQRSCSCKINIIKLYYYIIFVCTL